jgi:hypothetical protein
LLDRFLTLKLGMTISCETLVHMRTTNLCIDTMATFKINPNYPTEILNWHLLNRNQRHYHLQKVLYICSRNGCGLQRAPNRRSTRNWNSEIIIRHEPGGYWRNTGMIYLAEWYIWRLPSLFSNQIRLNVSLFVQLYVLISCIFFCFVILCDVCNWVLSNFNGTVTDQRSICNST